MYDLILMPMNIQQGEDLLPLPGFHAAGPPKRAARSRSEDMLILSLMMSGSRRISPENQQAWLERLSQIFFKSNGSVTSALRSLIETLNLTIMEKNLKLAQEGSPTIGAINLAAIHRRHLFIAQSGLIHAYALTQQGLQHFYDASQSDRGLGLSRTPAIRYYQAALGDGGYLFMTDSPPDTWADDLLLSNGFPNVDQLRRRLLNQSPSNFQLGLVQIKPGEGIINTLQSTPTATKPPEPEASENEPNGDASEPDREMAPMGDSDTGVLSDTEAISNRSVEPLMAEPDEAQTSGDAVNSPSGVDEPIKEDSPYVAEPSRDKIASPQTSIGLQTATIESEGQFHREKENESAKKQSFSVQGIEVRDKIFKSLAGVLEGWRKGREGFMAFTNNLFTRWAPEGQDGSPKLPRSTQLLIAIVVPLVVVAIAVGVYLSRGRTLQYQYYYEQAEASSQSAIAADNHEVERVQWLQTLQFLDQAEAFRNTSEIASLRNEAEAAMDILDGAVRLRYHPAITGSLPSEINITRIIAYGPDLYLFDGQGGRVIHAIRATQGYEINADFVCGPGNYGGGGVDTLVDMVSLPINNPYQAHILAVDAIGNVIYCSPGQDPFVQTLPTPNAITGEITKIAYESNLLYVLNPSASTVRVYRATNGQFLDSPTDYFGEIDFEEKPDISKIVDLAVNGSELYLLRSDGLLVDCVYSGLPAKPVSCENPVTYVDGRQGKEEQAVLMPNSDFASVFYSSPPDPAVSILDATTGDIYRFSLRFRLHQRLRPNLGDHEIDHPTATAFTIAIDRVAYLAFGDQVFYAYVE